MLDLTRWKNRKRIPGTKKSLEPRVRAMAIGFGVFGLLIIGKLFDFQVLKFDFYQALASDQHDVYQKLFPERGSIYVKDQGSSILAAEENLYPLAINKDYNLVYAQPKYLDKSPQEIADLLVPILASDPAKKDEFIAQLIAKLSKSEDPYEPLMHKVEDSQAEQIKNLNLKGIKISKETFRYYPENNFGANILGYVGFADDGTKKGYYGIEGYYDKDLAGKQGEVESEKDITGNLISFGEKKSIRAQDGDDVVLTIDKTVQYEVCRQLDQRAQEVGAKNGAAIVMNPQTGAIIAMCSYPDFDPNDYGKVTDAGAFNNEAIFEPYEPGSIFKPLTMAAALDLGKISPATTYQDTGEVKIDKFTIRNADKKGHGIRTMTQVLEGSLNTGAIFAMRQIGKSNFLNYVKKFGLGQKTGIELNSEGVNNISALDKKGEIYAATSSFGQGITATPIQMVQAYSAIANGGKMVKPYIVEQTRKSNGIVINHASSNPLQVISSKTATLLTGMMVSVIKNGQGKKAGVAGYYLAGKSGTAQIADPAGGYYASKTNHSFIGFGPISNPQFLMMVKLGEPQKGTYAESTAMPLFSKLAKFLFDYYHIMPDDL